MADFIDVGIDKNKYFWKWRGQLNQIAYKHVDFLLCDALSAKPILAIELDDSTHEKMEAQARDKFVDMVYRKIGLNFVHFKIDEYDEVSVEQYIVAAKAQNEGVRCECGGSYTLRPSVNGLFYACTKSTKENSCKGLNMEQVIAKIF